MTTEAERSGGALVVSLDLELAWGAREGGDAWGRRLERASETIRRILDLFEQREIHATWACVGLMFARDVDDARRFAPRLRPSYREAGLSAYDMLDRGQPDAAPGCYFAPELIATIAARPNQEIGTQTFSWYHCNEPGQTAAQFDADLAAAVAIAERSGVQLRSLVFPRDQCNREYLPILARHGISAYRSRRPGWAYAPSTSKLLATVRRGLCLADNFSLLIPDAALSRERILAVRPGQPVDIPASRHLRPYDPRFRELEPLRGHRMQFEMTTCADRGQIYHLWMRPLELADHIHENLVALDNLLRNARALANRVGFPSLTMSELASAALP
ncbi:MAG TPA: polysaccharide deacetylase family protein [Enhygromyxa sp.]|nr:polysaccharide deacetylase family protein [Enhygromyxa sp.]